MRKLSAGDLIYVIDRYSKRGVHFRMFGVRRLTILWECDGAIPDRLRPLRGPAPALGERWR